MALYEPQLRPAIDLAHEPPFRLGDVAVTPATRQIVRGERSTTVEPRIMQALVALAEAKGEILSRDDLVARCWGGRIVGDNAIHRAVSKVRDLGLNFASGAFRVETITKVGYRMIVAGDVREVGPIVGGADEARQGESGPPWNRRHLLLAGAGAVVAGGGLAWLWTARSDPNDALVRDLIARSEQAMRNGVPDSDAQGTGFLEEAVAFQPDNALAWGRLAQARCVMAEHAPPERSAAAVAATQDAAQRALALEADQPDARSALALLPPYFGDWFAAENRMNAVLAIDPEHMATRDARAFMHVGAGRVREGCTDRLILAAREPLHAVHQFKLIYSHWILGSVAEADRAAERALQLWPKHSAVWFARLYTLAFTGRAEWALAHVIDADLRPNLPPSMVATLKRSMEALAGRRPADVEAAADALIRDVARGPVHSVIAVMILNGLGEMDRAFDVVSAYLLERGPLTASLRWRRGQLPVNDLRRRATVMLFVPVAAPMRADPRFAGVMEDMGLAAYWRRAGVTPDHLLI